MFTKDLLKGHLRRRFHVTPKDGVPFAGVLLHAATTNLEFGDVTVGGEKAKGSVFIDRSNVAYVQLVSLDAAG